MTQLFQVHQVPLQVLGTWHGLKRVGRYRLADMGMECKRRGWAWVVHVRIRVRNHKSYEPTSEIKL